MTRPWVTGLFGALLGFSLSRIGFSDFGEVHRMFLFQNGRLFLTFLGAVALLMALWPLLARGQAVTKKPFHPGILPGSLLFGVGWALTGACPPISLIQLAEGRLPALATLAGVAVGVGIFIASRDREGQI